MRPCVQSLPILGGPPAAAPRPVAGASLQARAEIVLDPLGAAVPKLISTFTNAVQIQPGPNNALFTDLGFGRLRYDGPPALFSIDGAVTVEASFETTLALVINSSVLVGTGSLASAPGGLLVASAVRTLNTNDVIELAIIPNPTAPADEGLEVLTFQLRVAAVGHVP